MIQTEEKSQQISLVSHEIRNHLSICDMYSQILKKNLEKEGVQNESVTNALECIQKSLQIINTNLLDLKSINQNNSKVLDFKSIVEKGASMSKAYVTEKDIGFEIFLKNTANIYADENRLLSCIVNIVKNGIEAITAKGEIKIYGEVKENNAILKISNNGKPIPYNKQKEIFTQGYTTKKSGNGLGLSICKNYLESQNASLRLVRSTKNETQFEIVIPVHGND